MSCQIVEYIALYAMNIGEFAVACDMTRYILKHKSAEVSNIEFIWLLRSLSFAAIGEYLLSLYYLTAFILISINIP
jgi:hypothetical protein